MVFLYKDSWTAELPAKTVSFPEDKTALTVNDDCLPSKRKDSLFFCVMTFSKTGLSKLIKLLQQHSSPLLN